LMMQFVIVPSKKIENNKILSEHQFNNSNNYSNNEYINGET
jgi:hypothetical protein